MPAGWVATTEPASGHGRCRSSEERVPELTAGARVRSATARQVALAYDTAVMRRGSFRGGRVVAAGYACHTTSAEAAEEESFAIRCANRGGGLPFRLGRVMRRRATLRVALRAAVAVGLVLVGLAFGGSGEGDEQASAGGDPSTSTTSSAPGDRSAFCALLAETSGEVEESYLGSAEHTGATRQPLWKWPRAARGLGR